MKTIKPSVITLKCFCGLIIIVVSSLSRRVRAHSGPTGFDVEVRMSEALNVFD